MEAPAVRKGLFDKEAWRHANYVFLRNQPSLWRGRYFQYAYGELLGYSGIRMYELMARHLKSPRRFVGFEMDAGVVAHHMLRDPPFSLAWGDVYAMAPYLFDTYPFAVLNLDTTSAIRADWWAVHRGMLQTIVERGVRVSPRAFVLIMNHALDRGAEGSMDLKSRIQLHAANLAQCFGRWGVDANRCASGVEDAVARFSHGIANRDEAVGAAGAFEVYRSERVAYCKRCRDVLARTVVDAAGPVEEKCLGCGGKLAERMRMLTVRLVFDGDRGLCRI